MMNHDGRQYQGPVPIFRPGTAPPSQGGPQGVKAVQGADGLYLVAVWTDQDRALVQNLHTKLDMLLKLLESAVAEEADVPPGPAPIR